MWLVATSSKSIEKQTNNGRLCWSAKKSEEGRKGTESRGTSEEAGRAEPQG